MSAPTGKSADLVPTQAILGYPTHPVIFPLSFGDRLNNPAQRGVLMVANQDMVLEEASFRADQDEDPDDITNLRLIKVAAGDTETTNTPITDDVPLVDVANVNTQFVLLGDQNLIRKGEALGYEADQNLAHLTFVMVSIRALVRAR